MKREKCPQNYDYEKTYLEIIKSSSRDEVDECEKEKKKS